MKIYVGHDSREDIAYQVCEHSIKRRDPSAEVIPLKQKQMRDQGLYTRPVDKLASTEFTFTRFFVPYMNDFKGWAVFCDSDMVFLTDANNLFANLDTTKAVYCVQHDYNPPEGLKMDGQAQLQYPRKNWSSMMIFNNAKCTALSPDYVNSATGLELHQFKWLESEDLIGNLGVEWNHLVGEYEYSKNAKLVHYTEGGPYFKNYKDCHYADEWFDTFKESTQIDL